MVSASATVARKAGFEPREGTKEYTAEAVHQGTVMSTRAAVLLLLVLLPTGVTVAKEKKSRLPDQVLKARTITVLLDPEEGISMTDPGANKTAREDVEKAFAKWGRFLCVLDGQSPDLVIVVRRGQEKIVDPAMGGGPNQNNRPVIVQPTDNGIRLGGQRGQPPPNTSGNPPPDRGPQPKAHVAPAEDTFVVYLGGVEYPLDHSPVWRYAKKDALRSPDVPAVAEFRKLLEEAEKQQNKP